MEWFVATIADRATLEVLLQREQAELAQCRASGTLGDGAAAFLVGSGTVVEIFANSQVRRRLGPLRGLAFAPATLPLPTQRGRPLVKPLAA